MRSRFGRGGSPLPVPAVQCVRQEGDCPVVVGAKPEVLSVIRWRIRINSALRIRGSPADGQRPAIAGMLQEAQPITMFTPPSRAGQQLRISAAVLAVAVELDGDLVAVRAANRTVCTAPPIPRFFGRSITAPAPSPGWAERHGRAPLTTRMSRKVRPRKFDHPADALPVVRRHNDQQVASIGLRRQPTEAIS
jgi:hypothetical protein